MPLFHYQSVDNRGKKQKGMVEALSLNEAKEKLRIQGVILTALGEGQQAHSLFSLRRPEALRGSSLVTFTTQLAQLLTAGVPLYESLLSLEEQYRHEKFHHIVLTLTEQIKGGSSLSLAMSHFPKSFNTLYCSMVAAGETAGILEKTLEKLATLLAKQLKLKKQLITAMLYPLLLGGFSLLIVLLLLTFVIPSLEALFADREVNRFTQVVMMVSSFLTHKWMLYLPLLGGLSLGVLYGIRQGKVRRWLNEKLLRTPLIKTVITQTAMARFCRTMGTLLEGGVPIIQALSTSRGVVRNPLLQEAIETAEKRIVEGSLLSAELKKSPWIPSLIPRMLAIGEEGGKTFYMFHKIADIYEEETEKTLQRLTALAQPVILLIMGGIVGIIMLAVLLPLTDVSAFI